MVRHNIKGRLKNYLTLEAHNKKRKNNLEFSYLYCSFKIFIKNGLLTKNVSKFTFYMGHI
jgi:hypothetical protein